MALPTRSPASTPSSPAIACYSSYPFWARSFTLRLLAGLLVLVGLPLAFGLYAYYSGYAQYGPATATRWSDLWFKLAIWLGALVIGRFILYRWWSQVAVSIHPEGLRWVRRSLNVEKRGQLIPWEQVTGIVTNMQGLSERSGEAARFASLLLLRASGDPLHWWENKAQQSGLMNLPELASRIKAAIYPRLQPALEEAYLGGQEVRFGDIKISIGTLTVKNQSFPRDSLQQVRVALGSLMVELSTTPGQRKTIKMPLARIPNVEILLQLLDL